MTDLRALTLGLLASTALATPAFAQNTQPPGPTSSTDVTAPPAPVQQAQAAAGVPDQTEIIITATKREENLQNVPISVQVLGTRKLDQLNISNFQEYTKQLPSVTFLSSAPGFTTVYMRGIAATSSGEGIHSGPLPQVGVYLDEQPVTTIGGALDVHIYDIARIESLAGPQGTLFGASSEAGTIRIITNKPELGVTTGRLDAEINDVSHGDLGGKAEGMINLPITPSIAFRGVAFWQRDAGFIDNVFTQHTYFAPDGDVHVDNSCCVKKNINDVTTYGGRAALKIDLDENWTILPQVIHQHAVGHGFFAMNANAPEFTATRYQPEVSRDKWTQAALTIEGKIANFDLTYAGAYLVRPRFTNTDYADYTIGYDAYYQYLGYEGINEAWTNKDNAGNNIDPRQHIIGTDHFKKLSQELRIASPADKPIRGLVGAFYQDQKNHILQDYLITNLATSLSVTGYPGTVWLTNQRREDKDWAVFGEGNWDVTHTITLTGGLRFYRFNNILYGFAGYGLGNPPGSLTGENRCLTVNGLPAFQDPTSALATGDSGLNIPCYNVADVVNGKAVPRRSKGSGHIYRLNAQWKPAQGLMFYATWSKGFRPGGINRQPNSPAYAPDFLYNVEAGWKTTLLGNRIRWNGAIYHQIWKGFQFGFLGENSLTVVQNARDAKVNGIETDINYTSGGLSLSATAAYTDAKTKGNICNASISVDPSSDCSGLDSKGRPDFVVTPSGTRLPVTPKFKGSATARYQWPIGPGKAHVQGSVTYQGSAGAELRQNAGGGFNPNTVLGRVHASTLVDLFAGYDWGKYSVELFGTNVFSSRNELARFAVCAICEAGFGPYPTKILTGRPRTIGVRLGAKF